MFPTLTCLICKEIFTRHGGDTVTLIETARKKGWKPIFLRLGAAAEWQCPTCAAKTTRPQACERPS